MAKITSLAGATEQSLATALGYGVGVGLAAALTPEITLAAQERWNTDPSKVVDPGTAASIVAEGLKALQWGRDEANRSGIDNTRFDLIWNNALRAPDVGELLRLLRRSEIQPDEFLHGLRKAKLEPEWDVPLAALQHELLDPSALATAIHRGIIAGQGLIVREPPAGEGRVPHVEQSNIDAVKEAEGQGITQERLRVLVGNTGLPLSLGEMLQLLNRGKVLEDDVRRSIAQSNVRNEYMDVALDLRRRLLTPHEYEEAALRGIITNAAADQGAALSGMEAADAQLLFEIMGRPIAVHAITTGLARGAELGGTYNDVPEPYRDAIRRSNIRPEYAKLAYANRYNFPSAFVLRSLAQSGELPAREVEPTLLKIGWEPDFAKIVAAAWTGGKTTKGDPHVTKAENQVWTALHKSYVDNLSTDAETTADLATLGVTAAAIPEVVRLWQAERAIVRRSLTPAQIKKAIGEPGRDAAWAKTRLLDLGYSAEDADAFLAE